MTALTGTKCRIAVALSIASLVAGACTAQNSESSPTSTAREKRVESTRAERAPTSTPRITEETPPGGCSGPVPEPQDAAETSRKAGAAGNGHGVALREDGTVWTWDEDTYIDLMSGTTTASDRLVPITGLAGVTAISAGMDSSIALLDDGTVMIWEDEGHGEVGCPIHIADLSSVTSLSAGWSGSSYGVRDDGTLWSWRDGFPGECCDFENTLVPVQVDGLSDVIAISTGWDNNLALRTDGTVWNWGINDYRRVPEQKSWMGTPLPPVGWADVATKRDLEHLEVRFYAELDQLEAGLRSEIALLGAELRGEMHALRAEIEAKLHTMSNRNTVLMLSCTGAIIATSPFG